VADTVLPIIIPVSFHPSRRIQERTIRLPSFPRTLSLRSSPSLIRILTTHVAPTTTITTTTTTTTTRDSLASFTRVSRVGCFYRFDLLHCRHGRVSRLFPAFPFSQFTSSFLARTKRQRRISQRPVSPRTTSHARPSSKREIRIFTRHSVVASGYVVPLEPTDRSTLRPTTKVTLLSFLSSLYAPRTRRGRVLSVHRRGIPARQFIRKVFLAFRARACERTYTKAYANAADAPRNCGNSDGDPPFFCDFVCIYIYIYICIRGLSARYDLRHHVFRVGIKPSKRIFARKQ